MAKRKKSKYNYVFSNKPVAKFQKKYCRFKKSGIRYIDYKDPDFLMKFVNEQGKILPRRLTGTSLKYQEKWLKLSKEPVTSPFYHLLVTN
jgi:small subunit ribosomal protein S18